MASDDKPTIEIVEPTEEERRAIFDKPHFQRRSQPSQLTPKQQDVIHRIERLIVEVGELGPGTIDCDVNPMFKHPYQRQAIHALEYAHSEVLNWFDRANRGFHVDSSMLLKSEPEKQE